MRSQTKAFERHAALLAALLAAPATAKAGDATAPAETVAPSFIGSLLSPTPAVARAGLLAIQPTFLYTLQPGTYDVHGGSTTSANKQTALQTLTVIRYGITDDVTIQLIPTSSQLSDQQGFKSGSHAGDTSADLEYFLMRQDNKTGQPSITASVGMDFPTGRYQGLSNANDGYGNGTFRLRLGLVGQSILLSDSPHPIRIRVYANGEIPVSGVGLHGFSTFGTDAAFNGYGKSGIAGSFGTSLEYSVTKALILAFDIYHGLNTTNHVYGFETNGTHVNVQDGNIDTTQVAAAFEYSFTDKVGIIAGAAFSVAGHNTTTLVQPQVALNLTF